MTVDLHMISPLEPQNEKERLAALDRCGILDSDPDAGFEDLVQLTALTFQAPIAFVGVIARERQWMKARIGLETMELPRDRSFCAHAILGNEPLVIPDAERDARFADSPLVKDRPGIRFYAGIPLLTQDRHALGTLAIMDFRPRELTRDQLDILRLLSRQVMARIELNLSRVELQKTRQGLEAAKAELVAFSYSVSHDLRGPLRGIDGWSQALLEDCAGKLDEQGRGYLQRVRTETQRMGQLIDDLLQLSRLNQTELRPATVDLSAIAAELAGKVKEREPARQVEFLVQPGLVVNGDFGLIREAMGCLLDNAWKFTSKRELSVIEFGRANTGSGPAFFIRDNGAGFDMAYVGKLFAPFQRLHKVSEFPGTGIGLAKVHRVLHRHGGRIWAESRVGQGATFYFTLG